MEGNPYHKDLLNNFHKGDATAIRLLYDLHYKPLCWFAEKLLNNKQEAEDIALDSFVKLLNKKEDFNDLRELQSFLYTATRNSCYNFLRDTKRHDASHKELQYLSVENEVGDDEELMAKILSIIYAEMENLPGQCKKVFKGIFLEGKNTEQVAQELGITTQTVLNQKSRAIRQLRLSLYKEGLYSTVLFLQCLLMASTVNHS